MRGKRLQQFGVAESNENRRPSQSFGRDTTFSSVTRTPVTLYVAEWVFSAVPESILVTASSCVRSGSEQADSARARAIATVPAARLRVTTTTSRSKAFFLANRQARLRA
jgi:hypothetical protein